MSHTLSPSSDRLHQLTGLRFVAALGVVLCHYAPVMGLPVSTQFLTNFLGSGVALFFVLSGLVLTHTYEAAWRQPDPEGRWWRNYLCARFARVMPLYWLSLLCVLLVFLVFGFQLSQAGAADRQAKLTSLLINALAMQAWFPDFTVQQYWNAPAWSVSSELFFYLCFPVLLRVRGLNGSLRSLAMLWGVMALLLAGVFAGVRWGLSEPLSMQMALAYTVRCPLLGLFCFVLGIHLVRGLNTQRAWGLGGRHMAVATGMVLQVAWLVAWQKGAHAFGFYVEIVAIYLVYTPYFYVLLRHVLTHRDRFSRGLAHPLMVRLGDASYALYLLHWVPLCLLLSGPEVLRHNAPLAALTVVVLVPLSVAVFHGFEEPWRARIRRAWMRPVRRPVAPDASCSVG